MSNFTFCIILSLFVFSAKAEFEFQSPELQKLHDTVKNIKAVPFMNLDMCKIKLGKEVLGLSNKLNNDDSIEKLKTVVSAKENVDISNIHSLKELFNNRNFSSLSSVIDNTFCFVNLPQDQISEYQDRIELFNTLKSISDKVKFVVLFDDGFEQGSNVTKLYVYGVDSISQEAYAIKADVE